MAAKFPSIPTSKPVTSVNTAWTGATLQRDRRISALISTWLAGHVFSLSDLVKMAHVRLAADAAALAGHRVHPQHAEAIQGAALEQIVEAMTPQMGDPKQALAAGLKIHAQLERALTSASGMNAEGLARAVAQGDLLVTISTLAGA